MGYFRRASSPVIAAPIADADTQGLLDSPQSPEAYRPGKFADLKTFFADGPTPAPTYRECTAWGTRKRGCIIHLQATDVTHELHNRVMLVTRLHNASMTCFAFCRHDDATWLHDGHLQAVPATPEGTLGPADKHGDTMQVTLSSGVLKEGVLINLDEPYNVHYDKHRYAILGYVQGGAFQRMADFAGKLYREGMEYGEHQPGPKEPLLEKPRVAICTRPLLPDPSARDSEPSLPKTVDSHDKHRHKHRLSNQHTSHGHRKTRHD